MSIRMSSNKQYVIKKQNLEILKSLKDKNVKICQGADGSRINLDPLTKTQLTSLKKKVKEIDVPIEI